MTGTFVSIGNGTQEFSRLLDEVKRISDCLPQPVVVQHGRSRFTSTSIAHFDFTDEAGFLERLNACSLFITHGGGGSVFSAIRAHKRPVVVPRRKIFDEIVDDHQVYFAQELARQGKIVPVYDVAGLARAAADVAADPQVADDSADIAQAVAAVREAVHAFAPNTDDPVLLVTPSGGHLTEMRNLAPCYEDRPHHYVINMPIIETPAMVGRTTTISVSQRDWKFFVNLGEAMVILRRERPRVILTTGGGFSVAFTLVAKLLRIPTVYVETVAKVVIPTATGRVMYRLADRFFYQWPYLQKFFPTGHYIGLIL